MRYPASEKLEIIHLIERPHLLVKQFYLRHNPR